MSFVHGEVSKGISGNPYDDGRGEDGKEVASSGETRLRGDVMVENTVKNAGTAADMFLARKQETVLSNSKGKPPQVTAKEVVITTYVSTSNSWESWLNQTSLEWASVECVGLRPTDLFQAPEQCFGRWTTEAFEFGKSSTLHY